MYQKQNTSLFTGSRKFLLLCVLSPLFLALLAIFSTLLPPSVQQQIVFGMPIILWFWFALTALCCVLLAFAGRYVLKQLATNAQ